QPCSPSLTRRRSLPDALPIFSTAELLARIRAISRRGPRYTEDILQFEDLALDRGGMELSCGKNSIRLGKKEFELMELFLRNPCRSEEHTSELQSRFGVVCRLL